MSNILDEFVSLVTSRKHGRSRGFIKINCPACGDTRLRGGLLLTDSGGFRYSCFNGGCPYTQPTGWEPGNGLNGRVRQLFETLGGDIRRIPPQDRRRINNLPGSTPKPREPNRDVATKFPDVSMPAGSMLLEEAVEKHEEAQDVLAYLNSRSPLYLEVDYPFMWSPKYPQHLLIPFLHYGQRVVGYMGRKITNVTGGARFIQRSASDFMFNQYLLSTQHDQLAFVMESPLDAILFNGIATRDNRLSTRQINLLNQSGRTPVLVPDQNQEDAEPFMKAAEDNGWFIAMPRWDMKDPGEAITKKGLLWTVEAITSSMTKDYKKARQLQMIKQG